MARLLLSSVSVAHDGDKLLQMRFSRSSLELQRRVTRIHCAANRTNTAGASNAPSASNTSVRQFSPDVAFLIAMGLLLLNLSPPNALNPSPCFAHDAGDQQRVMHFPADQSIGDLYVVSDQFAGPRSRRKKYWVSEARGSVRLKNNLPLSLLVSMEGSQHADFLKGVGPNDLYSLDLSDGKVTDRQLQQVVRLTGLKVLNLTGAEITDDGLKYLNPLTNLRYLFLNITAINGSGLKNLAGMKVLERLDLRGTEVDDRGIMTLPLLPSLTAIVLRDTKITNDGLKCLRMTAKLESLDCSSTNVTGQALLNARFTPSLLYVSLQNSTARDDASAYLAKVKLLQSVDVSGCQLTDKFFANPLPGLERLDIGRNKLITNAGAAKLAQGSPRLQHLRLRWTGITDDAMRSLRNLKHLTLLDLENTNITDAGLNHLQEARNLTDLVVPGTRVTQAGISRLAKALPKCHINHGLE